MICRFCGKEAFLILSACAECAPELHAAHARAIDSLVDDETITPDVESYYTLLEARKVISPETGEE